MKKFARFFSLLIVALMLLPATVKAQQLPALGVDPEVRIGTLPNGLTYYIRHNEYPKGQADFYIAQKVGSILEDDNQRGLAHFLEHMCFNGTTNYPEKNLINYLESVGVKFGYNLNAQTGFDNTIYNISNVPTSRTGIQDSCLLILHDWANDLLLEDAEIDAERKVIHEEWRKTNVGEMRILEQLLPTLFPDSKYGHRLPIGTMEVVDNFPYKALRDYYEKWYRPDQQGIIVVGDIDVDRIEGKIKEMFSDIEMPADAAVRTYFPVPDTKGTIYAIGHDKEQDRAIAELMIKTDPLPRELRGTMASYVQNYITYMITHMLNNRLNEISSKPDAPFAAAAVVYGDYIVAKTKDAFTVVALSKTGVELPSALAAAYRELLRASRGAGFTVTEFDRAKAEYLSRAEKAYNNRNQRRTAQFVKEYVDNFVDGDPIPSADEDYQTIKQVAAVINLDMINQSLKQMVTPDNRVLLAMMPDSPDGVYPTEEQFASALKAIEGETIEDYKEEVKAEPLIEKLPAPGKIVKTEKSAQWDAEIWTLSNGVKVMVKPTTFKDNEILFRATALNGTADIPDSKMDDLRFLDVALEAYGLGTYSNSDLRKYLSGKQAGINFGFGPYNRFVSGSTTKKDLPTLMELIYMGFTNVNFTDDEFEALKKQQSDLLENQEKDPMFFFRTKLVESLYGSPRLRPLLASDVDKADRQGVIDLIHQMTDNAAEFDFLFVGSIDTETLKPLVAQYIATLPANAKKARKSIAKYDSQYVLKGGKKTDTFTTKMETPQTWCYITEFGSVPYTMKDAQLASIAGQVLSKRLIDIVREKEGAVYSISADGSMERLSPMNTEIMTAFPMKPEMKDKVLDIIAAQIADMANNIDPSEVNKAKEFMVKNYADNRELNNGWLNAIVGWTLNGVDTFHGNTESVNSITVDDVKKFVKDLNAQGNYRVVILDPETK